MTRLYYSLRIGYQTRVQQGQIRRNLRSNYTHSIILSFFSLLGEKQRNLLLNDSIAKYVVIEGLETIPYRGTTIKELKDRVIENDEIKEYKNIIIHVGTNDIKKKTYVIMSDMMGLVEVVAAKNTDARITISNIIPRSMDHRVTQGKIIEINREIKQYAKERGINYTRTDKLFREGYVTKWEYYAEDGLHLNFEGTLRLTDLFREVLWHK